MPASSGIVFSCGSGVAVRDFASVFLFAREYMPQPAMPATIATPIRRRLEATGSLSLYCGNGNQPDIGSGGFFVMGDHLWIGSGIGCVFFLFLFGSLLLQQFPEQGWIGNVARRQIFADASMLFRIEAGHEIFQLT